MESLDCDFIKDTYKCELRTRTLAVDDRHVDLSNRTCQADRLRVRLEPYVYDHPLYHAELSLNVSLTILDQSSRAAAIRLICLEGGPKEFYCVNRTRPAHWDQFYHPCRLFDFSTAKSSSSVVFPLHFYNDCFRLSAFSIFVINVTLYPQNCVASFIFRMPSLGNVLATDATQWTPLVSVDANADDGVQVNFSAPPPAIRVRRVAVELYEILPSDQHWGDREPEISKRSVKTILRRRATVLLPETSVFFVDLPKATYSVYVRAEHSSCESEKCVPMPLQFNLTKDRYTLFTQKDRVDKERLESAWLPVTAAVVGIVVAFVVIAVAVVIYLRWKAARRKRQLLSK